MTLLTFLCQLISTTTFILMCHLILSKRLPRKITYPLYLYTIFICIFLAPFSGQYGIPIFLLGAIIILLFHKKDRLYNLLFFQILWAWSGASSDTELSENHRSTIRFQGHRIATCLYRTPMGSCV